MGGLVEFILRIKRVDPVQRSGSLTPATVDVKQAI
jgi:hypothetical protein